MAANFRDPNLWATIGQTLNQMAWAPVSQSADPTAPMRAYQEQQQAAQQKNATLEWLKQNNPDLAAMVASGMSPNDALSLAYKQKMEAAAPKKFEYKTLNDSSLVAVDPFDPSGVKTVIPGQPKPKMSDLALKAQEAGYVPGTPEFQDFMRKAITKPLVQVDTGVKLPSGFKWVDPNDPEKGMTPIKGGPAEQIPGELAARIGVADVFLKKKEGIKQQITNGDATGLFDVANGKILGRNSTYADIETGVEAYTRLLTGAGMNILEAQDKARQFLPSYTDTPETLSAKVDRLAENLQAAKTAAMRGRGADPQDPNASQQPNTGGVIDYTDYFKKP